MSVRITQQSRAKSYDNSVIEDIIYRINDGGVITDTSFSMMTTKDVGYMTGADVVGYHSLRRKGVLLPYTPFTQYFEKGTWTGISDFTNFDNNTTFRAHFPDDHWRGGGIAVPNHSTAPFYVYQNEAELSSRVSDVSFDNLVQGAAAKVYANGHDSLTFLAEFRKTASMVMNLKSKILKFQRKNKLSINDVASNWLEYRYGWRIIYYDIISIVDAVNSLNDARTRFTQNVGLTISGTDTTSHQFDAADTENTYGITFERVCQWEASCRGSVTADINPPKFRFNPVTTSWELVKFSFIVDWIIDIGMWLEALSFLVYQESYQAARGYHVTSTATITGVNPYFTQISPPDGWDIGILGFTSESVASLTVRVPQEIPTSLPSVDINLDIPKVADLLALFVNPSGSHART